MAIEEPATPATGGLVQTAAGSAGSTPLAAAGRRDEAIVDAALAAVLDVGIRRLTIADVARRAGVSRPTIYRRWPDTGAIIADLLTREISRAVPAEPVSGNGRDRLVVTIVGTVKAITEHPLLHRISVTDPQILAKYLVTRRGASQQALLGLLRSKIADGQADGSIRPGDPQHLAAMILLIGQSAALSTPTVADFLPGTQWPRELAIAINAYLLP